MAQEKILTEEEVERETNVIRSTMAKRPAKPQRTNDEAEALLAELDRRQAEAVVEALKVESQDYIFFLRCKRRHKGLFFTANPLGRVIEMTDWFTTYKKPGDLYLGEVYCQVCLGTENHRERMPIIPEDRTRGTWRPELRHIFRTPRDAARAKVEGDMRACDMPFDSQNVERQSAPTTA